MAKLLKDTITFTKTIHHIAFITPIVYHHKVVLFSTNHVFYDFLNCDLITFILIQDLLLDLFLCSVDHCLSFSFVSMAIVLSVLRLTVSDYQFGKRFVYYFCTCKAMFTIIVFYESNIEKSIFIFLTFHLLILIV